MFEALGRFLWLLCEPRAPKPPGFHTTARELQTHTFQRSGLQKHHQNATTKTPERERRMNFVAGGGKKRAKFGAVQGKGGPAEGLSGGGVVRRKGCPAEGLSGGGVVRWWGFKGGSNGKGSWPTLAKPTLARTDFDLLCGVLCCVVVLCVIWRGFLFHGIREGFHVGVGKVWFGPLDRPSPGPKMSLFFLSPPQNSFFSSVSGCLLVEFWWCFFFFSTHADLKGSISNCVV